MFTIFNYIMIIAVGFIAFVVPIILTAMNIYNCVSSKPKKEKQISCLTVILGGILYMLLHFMSFEEAGDWNERIDELSVHNSISSEYMWCVILIIMFGILSYFTLLLVDAKKIPPLVCILSIVALVLFNIFQIVYAIQIEKNVEGFGAYLYIYHFNIILLSASVLRKQIRQQVAIMSDKVMNVGDNKKFQWLYSKMNSVSKYTIIVFISLFVVIAIFEIIFVLAGQGIDAPIKAFTDTADWTFSQQIPPPPLDHRGHYLCTVAAGGHEKVVKPLRLGTRRGETIVVNRQLCIANAFEEVIQEKFPKFHKKVRSFYDTYGYPISKHITTAFKADITYILMKPLEWIFLIFLYMVDIYPEQRISRQYKYNN